MCYTTESYEDDVSVLRQINPNIIALDEKTLEAELTGSGNLTYIGTPHIASLSVKGKGNLRNRKK